MFLPILLNSWQGAEISTLEALGEENYEQLRFNTLYRVLSTIVAVLGGFGSLAYYTALKYRELEKKNKEKDSAYQTGDNSGSKEQAINTGTNGANN